MVSANEVLWIGEPGAEWGRERHTKLQIRRRIPDRESAGYYKWVGVIAARDPGVIFPPIVLVPLKLEDGATTENDKSVSFQSKRVIPAGLLNAVLASYAFAASPAKAFAIQSVLPSRRAKLDARTGRMHTLKTTAASNVGQRVRQTDFSEHQWRRPRWLQ